MEEANEFFLTLLLILLFARLFGELAAWLKVPSVMGEMLAGIVLGPSLLGWVEPTRIVQTLAEIGLILLLFEVGLETDLGRLAGAGRKASIVAVGGFVAPFAFGFAASLWMFDLPLMVALFVGGTLTATSIGVTVRVLKDLNRQKAPEAQVVLGAAVLDDILGVVLLAMLYEFSLGGGINLVNASKVLIFIAIFMVLAPIVAKIMARILGHYDQISKLEGVIPTTIVSLVLFFAWVAHAVGAPALLGGFTAGLALSRRFFLPFGVALLRENHDFVHRIEHVMKPIIHLFTPIFFVAVGLSLNLREVDWSSSTTLWMSAVLIVVAVLSKLGGALFIREPLPFRMAVGIAMIPRAEVGLIFAELGRVSGVFDNDLYAVLIITIAVTTILPPFMLKWFYARFEHRLPAQDSG